MSERRTVNLFVAHSPFQAYVADHMTARMPEFERSINVLMVDSPTLPMDAGGGRWGSAIRLDPAVGPSVRGAKPRLQDALRSVSNFVVDASVARLFVANVQWPLNNVLFGRWPRMVGSAEQQRCNYPEGIGSLRLVYPNWGQKMRDLLKSMSGLLGGVYYYPLRGDLMGLEASDRIYSLMPGLVPSALQEKVVAIPLFETGTVSVKSDTLLFLGQFDKAVPTNARKALARHAAEVCRELGYGHYLYKQHHYRESAEQRDVFLGQGFELLDDPRPVEQLLADRPVACVASFVSSALVHLKMMFGDSIRCLACYPEEFGRYGRMNQGQEQELIAIFRRCGVEIVPSHDFDSESDGTGRP